MDCFAVQGTAFRSKAVDVAYEDDKQRVVISRHSSREYTSDSGRSCTTNKSKGGAPGSGNSSDEPSGQHGAAQAWGSNSDTPSFDHAVIPHDASDVKMASGSRRSWRSTGPSKQQQERTAHFPAERPAADAGIADSKFKASALATANRVLGDLHPSLVPLVIAKTTAKKGKGGRQPASDPRLDPQVDPKKAKRILANRQSAARSKLKQKLMIESLRAKHEVLACQQKVVADKMEELREHIMQLSEENLQLQQQVYGMQLDQNCLSLDGSGDPSSSASMLMNDLGQSEMQGTLGLSGACSLKDFAAGAMADTSTPPALLSKAEEPVDMEITVDARGDAWPPAAWPPQVA